jgi:hypothetical protein
MLDPNELRRAAREDARRCADGSMGVVVGADWLERLADALEQGALPQPAIQGAVH